MKKVKQWKGTGDRLRAARRRLRYGSVEKAAAAFGWLVGRLKIRENGWRHLDQQDAELYAAGYGVSAHWLLTGLPTTEHDAEASALMRADKATIGGKPGAGVARAAEALVAVRKARGFETLRAATAEFDLPYSTYARHEDGSLAMSVSAQHLYAIAYGIPAELLDPSRLDIRPDLEELAETDMGSWSDVQIYRERLSARKRRALRFATIPVFGPKSMAQLCRADILESPAPGEDEVLLDIRVLADLRASATDLAMVRIPAFGGEMELLVRRVDLDDSSSKAGLSLFVQGDRYVLSSDADAACLDLELRAGRKPVTSPPLRFEAFQMTVSGKAISAILGGKVFGG